MKKTNILLNHLIDLWKFMSYHNVMAPFPPYDTEYVEELKSKILDMQEDEKTNYDELPVAACKYCNSLHIEVDDLNNDICMRCGSINEVEIHNNIEEYLKAKKEREN